MSHILIVDDSPIIHRTLSLIIRKMGHQPLQAEDGKHALALIDSEVVDLAIIDMKMPGMNGLDLVEKIRANPENGRFPIIFLTGTGRESDQKSAMKLDIDGFLSKPVSSHQLRESINRLLS